MNRRQHHKESIKAIRGTLSGGLFDYSVNISLLHNYMYVEVPKVGCSTIKATLQKFEWGRPDYIWHSFDDVHQRELSPLLTPRAVLDFTERLNSGCWFQFCFVREPFSRLLSVYLDKMCTPSSHRESFQNFRRENGLTPLSDITFEDFVFTISAQNYAEMDNHWVPQHVLLCYERMQYDFVGRLENFEEDFKSVLSRIGADAAYMTDLAPHRTDSRSKLDAYYSSELEEIVAAKYSEDFELFGYSKTIG